MKRSTMQWTVSIPPPLSKEAERAAHEESRTRSELVREALRRYLEQRSFLLAKSRIAEKLRQLGIRTEEDVERLIDAGRT